MPAITLGLAEVEERLRALRRRLNALTAQHSVYVSVSAIIVVITALILVGLRGSAVAFRAATWCGAVVCLAAGVWAAGAARRRWLDVTATAHLADRRGALSDRLVTLIDLRSRPRTSRLAPVLVAQLLGLSKQWQPHLIAPRRVPRSVYALVAALLALGSTAFIERRPPAPPEVQTSSATAGALTDAGSPQAPFMAGSTGKHAADGPSVPGIPPAGELPQGQAFDGREASSVPPNGDSQQGASSTAAGLPGKGAPQPDGPPRANRGQGDHKGLEQPDNALAALPDRLQDAIRRAFHAQPMERPQQLAARADPTNGPPGARGDDQEGNQDRQRHDASDTEKPGSKPQAPQKGADAGAQKGPGKSKPGEQVAQRDDGKSPSQNFEGSSPAAGQGSSPGGLMDGKAQNVAAGEGATKTFKLTITSFLRAMEQKGSQPRPPSKKGGTASAPASGSTTQVALNERQLNDDALRKAEIPPEYEDIVRRVYSLRGDQ
jgi:hypothetical protein